MESFESAKSSITGSALGKNLSMTSSTSWNDVVTKIKGVTSYTSGTKSFTTTERNNSKCGFDKTNGAWLYIPSNGYYSTGYKLQIPWSAIPTLGKATASQVLSGCKFTNDSGINLTGTMTNRGTLNWSGSNTTYTVPAGYYSGGTLNSKTSYTNGYNAGLSAARPSPNSYIVAYGNAQTLSFTSDSSAVYVGCMAGTGGTKYNNFTLSGQSSIITNQTWFNGSNGCRMVIFIVNASGKAVSANWGATTHGGLIVKISAY